MSVELPVEAMTEVPNPLRRLNLANKGCARSAFNVYRGLQIRIKPCLSTP